MGLGQKIKDALHGDHQDRTYEDDHPPGTFPSDSDRKNNKYTDSHDSRHTSTTGAVTNSPTTDKSGYGKSSGIVHTTGAAAGTGLIDQPSHGHKHVPGTASTGTTSHDYQQTGSDAKIGHGQQKGQDSAFEHTSSRDPSSQDPYWGNVNHDGNRTSGISQNSASTTGPNVLRKDLPTHHQTSHGSGHRSIGSDHGLHGDQSSGGIHNSVVGAGSHQDSTARNMRTGESRDFAHTGAGGTGAGEGPGGFSTSAVSGSNLSSDPYDTRISDKDMGRDRSGHGAAGAGVGAGAGAFAASEVARRHQHEDMRDSGYSNGGQSDGFGTSQTRGSSGEYPHSHTRSGEPHSSMLDPYATGHVGNNKHGAGNSTTGERNFETGHQIGSTRTSGNNSPRNAGFGTGSAGTPQTLNTNQPGNGHYGPGHEGAKVMHKCQGCGTDNDISHYFKKDVVYRLGT